MIFGTRQFNKEIEALRKLATQEILPSPRKQQLKQVLLQRLQTETRSADRRYSKQERTQTLMRYVIATLLGLSLVGGTAFASNSAKPGDFLFPVKKAREQLEVTFAANDQAKANLQSKFAEERVNDLLEAKANASSTPVSSQVAAENEASSALATLLRVQTDLAAKGNTEAASAIGQTIARLQLKLETNGNQGNHGHDGGDQNSDGNQNNPDGNGRHGGSNTSPLLQLNTSADLQATASTSTQFRVNSHGDEETEQEGLPSVEGTSTVNSNLRLKIHNHSRDDD